MTLGDSNGEGREAWPWRDESIATLLPYSVGRRARNPANENTKQSGLHLVEKRLQLRRRTPQLARRVRTRAG
jgi:hypothetical protein